MWCATTCTEFSKYSIKPTHFGIYMCTKTVAWLNKNLLSQLDGAFLEISHNIYVCMTSVNIPKTSCNFYLFKHNLLQVHAACRSIIADCDEVARVRWEGHADNYTRVGFKAEYAIITPLSILRETKLRLYIMIGITEKIWNTQ